MTEPITLNLTLKELKLIDKYVEYNEETKEVFGKIKSAYPQIKMKLELAGKFEVVFYNGENYYRLEAPGDVYWYMKKYEVLEGTKLVFVQDDETHRLLEGLWFNQVKRGKYDDVVDEHKSPVEEAYKDWWGQYPELETDSEYDEMRWQGFQAGFQTALQAIHDKIHFLEKDSFYLEYDE